MTSLSWFEGGGAGALRRVTAGLVRGVVTGVMVRENHVPTVHTPVIELIDIFGPVVVYT